MNLLLWNDERILLKHGEIREISFADDALYTFLETGVRAARGEASQGFSDTERLLRQIGLCFIARIGPACDGALDARQYI